MNRFWERMGAMISRRTGWVLAAVAVVTVVLGFGATNLKFATGQDSYLEPSSTTAKDNERYQELFGGESMVVLFTMPADHTVVDLFTAANVGRFDAFAETLRQPGQGIDSVVTPVTALQWTSNLVTSGVATQIITGVMGRDPDPADVALRQADATLTLTRLSKAGEPSFTNPAWVSFLLFDNTGFSMAADGSIVAPPASGLSVRTALRSFFPDATHALAVAVVQGNASLAELKTGSDAVQAAVRAQQFEGADVMVTGTPTFLSDINDYLQRGMLTLGAIAIGVMVLVLAVVFRVRWRLLPLAAVVLGVVWGFGLFGYLGIDLSLVTISGLPILIGIGVEFAIQIHNRVEEECVLDHDRSPFGEAARCLGPPMAVATVSAVGAFLAMRVSRVPMIQDFGVLLAVGIVMLLVTGIVIPLAVLGGRERHRPTTEVKTGATERVLHWLGSLPRRAVLPLIAVAIVIPVVGVLLETHSSIESDPINWADQSTASVRNARRLERDAGFATTLGIFVETTGHPKDGVFTDQMAAFTSEFVARELAAEPTLVQASSLAGTVASLSEVPGTTAVPPTGGELLAAFAVAPPDIQRLLVSPTGNAMQVLFQVGPSSLEDRSRLVDRIESSIAEPPSGEALLPDNASATPAGLVVVGVALLDNLTANRAALTIAALLLVAAWLVLRYGDAMRAALTMIPVLLAVGGSAALAAALGIRLSPLTTVSGPLVVATCAEFSALLTARYVEGRRAGRSPTAAQALASERTGRAFIASALTTIGGFAVLMFAALPLLRDFGAVVTINVTVAVLSALVVVPPLIVWADEHGWFRAAEPTPHRIEYSPARIVAAAAGFALVAGAVVLVAVSTRGRDEAFAAPLTVDAAGEPATLPPPTTRPAPTTTVPTTTAAPTTTASGPTTTVKGATTVPTTTVPASTTLPPGPPERPTGLVSGLFYDALVGAGVDPGVARCAADNLVATTPEADLLAMGIANQPRPPEVDALIADAALACGVSQATLDQMAASGS